MTHNPQDTAATASTPGGHVVSSREGVDINAWREALTSSPIGDGAYRVARTIADRADYRTGITRPVSLDEIAYASGKDRDNVRKRYLPQLLDAGWLRIVHESTGRGDARRYFLTFGKDYREPWRDVVARERGVMVTPPTSKGGHGDPLNPRFRGVMVTAKGGHGDPLTGVMVTPPSSSSSRSSSLLAPPSLDEAPEDEQRESTDHEGTADPFEALAAAYTGRTGRAARGEIRTRAAAAWRDEVEARGIDPARVLAAMSDRPPARGDWLDAWISSTVADLVTEDRRGAATARRGDPSCPSCDGYGTTTQTDEAGRQYTGPCPCTRPALRAVPGDEAAARPGLDEAAATAAADEVRGRPGPPPSWRDEITAARPAS